VLHVAHCRTCDAKSSPCHPSCSQGHGPSGISWSTVLSYDPNSVSQEKGRLLTERSGGPSPVGLGQSEAEAEVAHRATPFSQVAAGGAGGGTPQRYGTGHKYPLGFSIRD
jgi:hypothetical protein